MTSLSDSQELTQVGPGTVMGNFMREYWIPAAKASELEADGAPVRLSLLGEKLIAFRDSSGRVGVMDHRCPHRCASLFLGRNEDNGIRCTYHGWKFDVNGNCVDMPNLPPEQDFKEKVHAKAYPTVERNGLIWVYLGARKDAPPLPALETTLLPEEDIEITFILRDCNWLQALEGDIDTSHFGFLHVGHIEPEDVPDGHPYSRTVNDRAPQFVVEDMPWGTSYGAYRENQPGETYWRIANFIFPFWTQQPQGRFSHHVHARAWVPLDDNHTMFVYVSWINGAASNTRARPPLRNGKHATLRTKHEYAPTTTDWFGRWRLAANEANDWRIDRTSQRDGSFYSGIDNIHLQDQAVTESMGPITDHDFEHLAPSDRMITQTRRRCLLAARNFRDAGAPAPGVDDTECLYKARSGFFVADDAASFTDAFDEQLSTAVRAAPFPQAAE
jgi:phenylpropionate dioxygenase-like ring-hydroxylating dioxygenase large terminal subunit